MSSGPPETRTASRATWVWGAGMLGYIFAVMQRTTFGVAGLDAADRFSISPATLSAFVFLQTAVYIVAQLPAGLLVDRWGSRSVLVVGGVVLAGGQLLLGFGTLGERAIREGVATVGEILPGRSGP